MAILTVQRIVPAGAVPTFGTPVDLGDSFPNTGREYVEVIAAGAIVTVVVLQQTPCNQMSAVSHAGHDLTIVVADGTRKKFGPFNPAEFNDTNGRVQMTYTNGNANGTVGVFAAPQS